jgi:hypothetical protein
MSLHQRCDVTVARASEQIALPMARNDAVFNLFRSFPNGYGINDLTLGLAASPRVP